MKKALFSILLITMTQIMGCAQSSEDLTKISEAVNTFAMAADQQNADRLDKILHPQYRAVVHRLFGGTDVSLMDKALYLQLIRDKKIGGDKRTVHLIDVDVVNNIATVKALFQGKELKFTTFVSLLKLPDGTWQIVGDMPNIEKV
jgi:hypothetical protein